MHSQTSSKWTLILEFDNPVTADAIKQIAALTPGVRILESSSGSVVNADGGLA